MQTAVDKNQGALDVIRADEDARRFRKKQLKTACSRDDRIAALLGELQLGSAASEDGDDELEAQAGPVLADAERSRVPTADASVVESLHSSLDVFLYAERMAQSAEVDASRVGAFVAHAESQLPSRRGARTAAAAPVPVAAPATGGERNPPATHADEAPPQRQKLKRRAPLEPSAQAVAPPPAVAAAPLAPLPAAPATLPQSSTRTADAVRPARPARSARSSRSARPARLRVGGQPVAAVPCHRETPWWAHPLEAARLPWGHRQRRGGHRQRRGGHRQRRHRAARRAARLAG